MEGLGEKFQKARLARNLTIEEAARMTKIRPNKLAEIEAEDFSHFPSLAYAKGFLLIYGKFLNVDVAPYLEAFETSERMTVDGYSYLQDNPAPKPRRTEVVRKSSGNKGSLMPLLIGVIVLVVGFSLLKLLMDLRRIKVPSQRDPQVAAASPTPIAESPGGIVAPRALPVDSTPAPTAMAVAPTAAPPPVAVVPSAAPVESPPPTAIAEATPEGSEPEVRRAEPVHAGDLVKAPAALATPTPSPPGNRFDIRPLRKTYVRITIDGEGGRRSSFERWIDVAAGPVQLRGKRIAIKVLDPSDVEIRKNGKIVARGDTDVRLE